MWNKSSVKTGSMIFDSRENSKKDILVFCMRNTIGNVVRDSISSMEICVMHSNKKQSKRLLPFDNEKK